MTLFRQLSALIVLVFAIVLAGTLGFSIDNTRGYLGEQLTSHAQDTATSLGMSLSPHLARGDLPVVESMVDAIFDCGYYREIRVTSGDGKALVERRLNVHVEGVPGWFVRLLPLVTPRGESDVQNGWTRAGQVIVSSHPGFAYRELWSNTVDTLQWALLTVVLAATLTIALCRSLLRPLRAIEAQAIAISEREFPVVEPLPGTREMRRVVEAMNLMSRKVRQMLVEQVDLAERMRREAYSDSVTELANRRSFERRLAHLTGDREGVSVAGLLLVQISGLDQVNRERGYAAGNELLCAVGEALCGLPGPGGDPVDQRRWTARIGGSEFAMLLPGASREEIETTANAVCAEIRTLTFAGMGLTGGHVGIAYYRGSQTPSQLLSEADTALRHAQGLGNNAWHMFETAPASADLAVLGAQAWRETLGRVIASRRVLLHVQEARTADRSACLHREVLARIPGQGEGGESGPWIPAGVFWPVAVRLGYATALDQIVVEQVIGEINDALKAGSNPAIHAVNLSMVSLREPKFVAWLLNQLGRNASICPHLAFEIAEYAAVGNLSIVREIATRLTQLGVAVGLDHFGASGSPFGYLQSLRFDYIKLDGGFVGSLTSNHDEQFYLSALIEVAHGLDIPVIAEFVETAEQLEVLQALHVDGVQGYFVHEPTPYDEDA